MARRRRAKGKKKKNCAPQARKKIEIGARPGKIVPGGPFLRGTCFSICILTVFYLYSYLYSFVLCVHFLVHFLGWVGASNSQGGHFFWPGFSGPLTNSQGGHFFQRDFPEF